MNSTKFKGAGQRIPLVDGIEKVTGKARYTADLFEPGALAGRIYRSPYAHAQILRVDVSEALRLPGVVGIITGADCDKTYGILPIAQNEYPLAREKVRYFGEPVAAVAAIDDATAAAALKLIRMEVREMPAYFTAAEARAQNAVLLHENRKGNLEREVHHEFGDAAAGFAAADLVREEVFYASEVTHAHMEPHATLASYDPERDRLTVHSVTQVPYYVHLMLAQCLAMDTSRIRVIKPFVGGGFGARTETLNFEIICGLLARAVGGTVKMKLSREETFLTHRGRPESEVRMKIGIKGDGRLTACQLEMIMRGGAYGGYGIVTILYAGALLNGLYDIPAVKYDGYRVYTNTPPCGAMRGHGSVNTRYAFECLLDRMARELGLDPLDVRRKNLLRAPTETINGLKVLSYGLPECIDQVERASGWRERKASMPPGRGLGFACSHYVSGAAKPVHWTGEPHATVILKLDFDAGVTILTGAADIGQGSSTIMTQAVVEVLGIDYRRIRVVANDSAITPKDNGSYSSRVTFMCGNAAIQAAENLKLLLVKAAAKRFNVAPEQVECLGEIYRVAADEERQIPFNEVVTEALVDSGTLTVKGTFTCPVEFQGGKHRGGAVGSTMGFSYAAIAVEVDVDQELGTVKVEKVWAAMDCGFAINPLSLEGQVQGAVWMGMAQALCEQTQYNRDGKHTAANFLEYRVPTSMDSPDIEVAIVESMDPNGPFGAKEGSEGPLSGMVAAVAIAVQNATGVTFNALPLTPDRVLDGIAGRKRPVRTRSTPKALEGVPS
ncbi:MAG TPA: 4-hydroxybenzoyl-CoA reductase subunit alpha [Burkholderiaceae bacterium]|nr:4-hydroxybenzoyl-CoA reductase subunit alpha [Burkholderiaceae bacterium]